MAHKHLFNKKGVPKRIVIPEAPEIGEPTLFSQGNGRAVWVRAERTSSLPTDQKSRTGWLARLNGGVQTSYDDAAALYIPIDEMPLGELGTTDGDTQWTYWMDSSQTFGCQISIWVHDPTDNSKRGDIIQLGNVAGLSKGSGWNIHILDKTTTSQFFYIAENIDNESDLITGSGNLHSLAQFQADTIFKTWTIYRISFNNGFENSGTFDAMYVADVKINGVVVPLEPTVAELLVTKNRVVATTSKNLGAATLYDATDVMSEATSNATDWDFGFGITGKITQAIVTSATTSLTDSLALHLYSAPPSCELDDHATNTSPVVGDLGDFIGIITFPALSSEGAGASHTEAISYQSGVGLPMTFNTTTIYGVLIDVDGGDAFLAGTKLTISLTAEI